MAVDWIKIKTEYISGQGSYRSLSKKYGVSESTLTRKAISEAWKAEREAQRSEIEAKTQQKAAEKISDSESEILAIKSRLTLTFYQQIEKRLQSVDEEDGQEFRRLVQNYKDMCDISDADGKQQTAVEDLTALAEKLRV